MPRKSSSVEERARDALCEFIASMQQQPLHTFLTLYFPRRLPPAFGDTARLRVQTEVVTNLGSRADIVIARNQTLLFVEVKVEAVEQVGQYEKYKHYFESQGYTVTAGGLINRVRSARTKDNRAFLETLGVVRVFWSEALKAFATQFGETEEFQRFRSKLVTISAAIGSRTRLPRVQATRGIKDPQRLYRSNEVLCRFYSELLCGVAPMEGVVWQSGNSPYCLMFGRRSWREKFHEQWFYRVFCCLGKNDLADPQFGFSVMLWNRTWTKNQEWFRQHRAELASYFASRGFDIGRNEGSSWHERTSWRPPYETRGLRYCNAFWDRRLRLNENSGATDWNALLARVTLHCGELARIVEAFTESKGTT